MYQKISEHIFAVKGSMQDKRQSVLNYIKCLNTGGSNDVTVLVNTRAINGVQNILKTKI